MNLLDILNRMKIRRLTCEVDGDYFDEDGDKFDICQYWRVTRQHKLIRCRSTLQTLFYRFSGQIKTLAHTKATVLIRCQCTGPIKIEKLCKVMELWCLMAAQGLTETLLRKPFYVYIVSLTARLENLPKFKIVSIASNPHLHRTRVRQWICQVDERTGEFTAERWERRRKFD